MICQKAVDLVKNFEGKYLKTYRCPAGVLTIGYGHTGADVTLGMVITEQEAEILLQNDLTHAASVVARMVHIDLDANQFGALASFVFNVGEGAFQNSTMLRDINAGNFDDAAQQFGRWVHGGGNVLPGLVRRRDAERMLFLSQYV